MDRSKDAKILKKGYKEIHGIFSTLGSIYWNVDVFDAKYHKWIRLYLYVTSISTFCIMHIMAYSVVVSVMKKDLPGIADSVGFFLIFSGLTSVITIGIVHTKNFDNFYRIVGFGYYKYQGEKINAKEIKQIKEEDNKKLLSLIKPFLAIIYFVTFACSTIQPLIYFLINRKVDLTMTKMMYPPLEIHFPFSPHTTLGYFIAVIIFMVVCIVVNPQIAGMDFMFILILSSLTTQWKILNSSVSQIPQRALQRYVKRFGSPEYKTDIYQDDRYQDCIYDCLVENIKHHQAITNGRNAISSYVSYCFLIVILNSSLLLASNGMMLIDAKLDILYMKYVLVISAEFLHVQFFCSFGDDLTNESAKLFHTIYSFPWYRCNTKVRKAQFLFMINTMNPMVERSAILGVTASLETFKAILSSCYTYINLLRKSS